MGVSMDKKQVEHEMQEIPNGISVWGGQLSDAEWRQLSDAVAKLKARKVEAITRNMDKEQMEQEMREIPEGISVWGGQLSDAEWRQLFDAVAKLKDLKVKAIKGNNEALDGPDF